MDAFNVPKKLNRHVLKAMHHLSNGNYNTTVSVFAISFQVKYQLRHQMPINDIDNMLNKSLDTLNKLGLIKRSGFNHFSIVRSRVAYPTAIEPFKTRTTERFLSRMIKCPKKKLQNLTSISNAASSDLCDTDRFILSNGYNVARYYKSWREAFAKNKNKLFIASSSDLDSIEQSSSEFRKAGQMSLGNKAIKKDYIRCSKSISEGNLMYVKNSLCQNHNNIIEHIYNRDNAQYSGLTTLHRVKDICNSIECSYPHLLQDTLWIKTIINEIFLMHPSKLRIVKICELIDALKGIEKHLCEMFKVGNLGDNIPGTSSQYVKKNDSNLSTIIELSNSEGSFKAISSNAIPSCNNTVIDRQTVVEDMEQSEDCSDASTASKSSNKINENSTLESTTNLKLIDMLRSEVSILEGISKEAFSDSQKSRRPKTVRSVQVSNGTCQNEERKTLSSKSRSRSSTLLYRKIIESISSQIRNTENDKSCKFENGNSESSVNKNKKFLGIETPVNEEDLGIQNVARIISMCGGTKINNIKKRERKLISTSRKVRFRSDCSIIPSNHFNRRFQYQDSTHFLFPGRNIVQTDEACQTDKTPQLSKTNVADIAVKSESIDESNKSGKLGDAVQTAEIQNPFETDNLIPSQSTSDVAETESET